VTAQRAPALRIGARAHVAIVLASVVGFAAFFWPFLVAPGAFDDTAMAPLMFGALLALVLAVVFSEVAAGAMDAKAVAMLGVLSALGAALRPLGAGTAGIETVFFTLIVAGRVFGPGFGFALGCTTLFVSALVTGGVGPWMPYQMFACAWVGMFAGCLPRRVRGRREVVMLALYGVVTGYVSGFLLNLSFWPFTLDPHSTISFLSGGPLSVNVRRYLVFDTTTSLGWDTGRALTNCVLLLVLGPAMLKTFRRAARRAVFEPSIAFEDARA
jgi:energy-coupling factor transport system substrate-specific component